MRAAQVMPVEEQPITAEHPHGRILVHRLLVLCSDHTSSQSHILILVGILLAKKLQRHNKRMPMITSWRGIPISEGMFARLIASPRPTSDSPAQAPMIFGNTLTEQRLEYSRVQEFARDGGRDRMCNNAQSNCN